MKESLEVSVLAALITRRGTRRIDGRRAGDGHGIDLSGYRRPGKSRVPAHQSVDLPSAQNLSGKFRLIPEERQIPQRKKAHVMFHVEIGRAVFRLRMRWIGLIGRRARAFVGKLVNALGVAILCVKKSGHG